MSDGATCRIVLVEDCQFDAELIERELVRGGIECGIVRVDRGETLQAALRNQRPDVVLCDYTLPGFSLSDALAIVKVEAPRTPVIVVTGSLDEETAVACLKAGAVDYVLKDRLGRLVSAILSALEHERTRLALERSEAELRHSQKMDAVGRLAAGVAHDFNNLLTVVLSSCDVLAETLTAGEPARALVAEIRGASEHGAALTRQLLTFARKHVVRARPLDLDAVVARMEPLLRRVIGEDIELAVRRASDPVWVVCDAGQIEQVLLNLSVNARDAMPGGGKLTVEIGAFYASALEPGRSPPEADTGFVLLAVSDTGHGMDDETRERLFEPFFTTKRVGTGLGLSTVYGIVKAIGGHIRVQSQPGEGARFEVLLPRAVVPEATDRAAVAALSPPLVGEESILLVEDNDQVRRAVRRMLEAHDYRVREAPDAVNALDIARGCDRIDLVITDVVMPGKSGIWLVEQLHRERADVPVLLVSGYNDEALARSTARPEVHHLSKPFDSRTLVERVREAIRTARGAVRR